MIDNNLLLNTLLNEVRFASRLPSLAFSCTANDYKVFQLRFQYSKVPFKKAGIALKRSDFGIF